MEEKRVRWRLPQVKYLMSFFLRHFRDQNWRPPVSALWFKSKPGVGNGDPGQRGTLNLEKNLKKYQKCYKNSGKYDWTDKCTVEIIWKWHHNVDFRSLYSQSMSTGGALYTYLPVEAMW